MQRGFLDVPLVLVFPTGFFELVLHVENHMPAIAASSIVGRKTNSSTSQPPSQTITPRMAPLAVLVAIALSQ